MKTQIFIYITNNEITNKKVLRRAFNELTDGRYLITIEGAKKRTTPQNSFYWGVVLPLVAAGLRDIGYREVKTNEDAHSILKGLFLKRKIPNEQTGEFLEMDGSTTDLTTIEFNNYIEEIAQWCSTYLGFSLPEPNQQTTFQFINSEN